jgi:hypothetical protein
MPCAYSLPVYFTILIPLRTTIAIPPLLPVLRRCSYTKYPGIFSGTFDGVSQVSCRQSTSHGWVSNTINSLYKLIPAIFNVPIFMPFFVHLCSLSFLFFLNLADPFVLFFFYFKCIFYCSCALFGT